ncbi:hypothetical protein MRB53_023942 [Persea americana]|uniref:Uncharacterized protein n=1 Tax=Persea americana TaxID=3435 RepID=A0ACC2LAY8_PERAE|nr:hypothetical protein MRB53_023942 [Persea americana]
MEPLPQNLGPMKPVGPTVSSMPPVSEKLPPSGADPAVLRWKTLSSGGILQLKEVLKKMEDSMYQKAIFDAALSNISSSAAGERILDLQGADIKACEALLS